MTRDQRIHLRISETDKAALERAAASLGLTLSQFMVMVALKEARNADRTRTAKHLQKPAHK